MDEMADQIRNAVGGADWDFQVSPRMLLKPTTPSIDVLVGPRARGNDAAGFGDLFGEHLFIVRARVAPNDHEANQDLMLDLLDDESDICIAAALLDDPTLNGSATSMDIQEITGFIPDPAVDGTVWHISCHWSVLVIPARS